MRKENLDLANAVVSMPDLPPQQNRREPSTPLAIQALQRQMAISGDRPKELFAFSPLSNFISSRRRRRGGNMGRKEQVKRSAEQKWEILQEGFKSGNVAETCRKHGVAPNLWYR